MEEFVTIKYLLALLVADIDIFLLREEDQETDKNKTFTVQEIRMQLHESINKIRKVCKENDLDIDVIIKSKKINF